MLLWQMLNSEACKEGPVAKRQLSQIQAIDKASQAYEQSQGL